MVVPAFLLTAAAAASTIAVPVDPAPHVASWAVDAGTTGALVEDHRAPSVSIRIEFPVGTWSAWAKAHHASEAFGEQDDDPERSLKKRADALGVDLGVGMGNREASVRATCLKRDLEPTLALIKDVLQNVRYDEKELKRRDRERAITWKGNETNVQFRLGQAAARQLFRDPEDPRRRSWEKPPALETHAAKLAASRDALIRFPGRAVGFAGDLTEDEAKAAARSLLPAAAGEAPADVTPRLGPLVPASERAGERSIPIRKLTQVYFAYGRDSLPWTDPRRPAYIVANHVFGGSFYSRLYVALRHESGDTYGAGTRESGDVAPGAYGAATFTRAPNAATIEAKLKDALAVFHDKGITEEERAAALGFLTGSRAFGRQSADQILSRWMSERRLGLPPGFLDDVVDRAAKLPLSEINAFIRDFYDPAQFTMIKAVGE
jgi:predicted Zn-dependent peptidase